ncbi:pirin family protein [Psychrobacter sp. KFRI-CH2-11]|uniref:pirin family protein n=1 Tax=Psychrobacter sp. KFRI-CH2-11 TaxID=3156079 RepID=UPI00324DBDDE
MRPIKHIHGDKAPHWIGDGFYVKTLINHLDNDSDINYRHTDPFLLFDYGQPTTFAPNPHYQTKPHGIGQHPHKGFEAVTVAYAGEISHADSTGGRGDILAGDAQWMTTGRGITHEEFHSEAFGARGGLFSMVQLWVNLPSAHKLTAPKYQSIKRADMPMVTLTADSNHQTAIGTAAIIAGDWQGIKGAASTFTPINLWDIALHRAGATTLQLPNTHNVLLLVQEGEVLVNGTAISAGHLIQFAAPTQHRAEMAAEQVATHDRIELCLLAAHTDELDATPVEAPIQKTPVETSAKLLLLSGEPIGEPVAAHGPFVMNTKEELHQTLRDYQAGRFGQ